MIFGYSSNAFVKFPLVDAIEKIARSGFGGLEIMCDRPHLYPPDFSEQDIDAVKNALKKKSSGKEKSAADFDVVIAKGSGISVIIVKEKG